MIRNWHPYIKTFKSPRLFNLLCLVQDWQGDGEIRLTIGVFYRSLQFVLPFPGDKIKFRCDWRLFDSRGKKV